MIFKIFGQILGFLIQIICFLSFSSKNDAEALWNFVKNLILNPKHSKFHGELNHSSSAQHEPLAATPSCPPACEETRWGFHCGLCTHTAKHSKPYSYLFLKLCLSIFWMFGQILMFLIKITWFLSFSYKNDAESLCYFVKILFLDLKRAKFDQKSEIGHVRTCQDLFY